MDQGRSAMVRFCAVPVPRATLSLVVTRRVFPLDIASIPSLLLPPLRFPFYRYWCLSVSFSLFLSLSLFFSLFLFLFLCLSLCLSWGVSVCVRAFSLVLAFHHVCVFSPCSVVW